MSIFNFNEIFVSLFSSVRSSAQSVSLMEIIQRLSNGSFQSVINLHASLEPLVPLSPEWTEAKKKGKAGLECWTPSCEIIEGMTRADANVKQMSGVMAFDFDLKDQVDKERFLREFKGTMAQFPYVFYAGYSASKSGFFALALTDSTDPAKYKPTYAVIAKEFEKFDWKTDPATSSLSNFRYVSYDPEPYTNLDVIPYHSVEAPHGSDNQVKALKTYVAPVIEERTLADEYALIEEKIRTEGRSSWADDYKDWIKVGLAFVDTFGEQGRELFHLYSALSPKYNEAQCDRKYNSLLRSSRHTVNIASFYHVCK